MQILGRPGAVGTEVLGISGQERQFWNLNQDELIQRIIINQECDVTGCKAVIAKTGKFTGRSPKDKYIVNYHKKYDDQIAWGETNQPIEPEVIQAIFTEIQSYLQKKDIYIQDMLVGQHPEYGKHVRIITETAWHSLFARDLFVMNESDLDAMPDYSVVHVPGFFADKIFGLRSGTFVILDFEQRLVLIGGTSYAGEIKKAVFTILNRILPENDVLPMHCSANIGAKGDSTLFFGLSGTGKTTLSSDPERRLIGDDEHGWGKDGVFNFEGGCYAKTIGLQQKYEPLIWNACLQKGTVLENVVYYKETDRIDFNDGSITENTRAAYPLENILNYEPTGRGPHPSNIFFLSADAFGVLPPIARLDDDQVMYYFLAGFTAKLAGTELGLGKEPQATFSACFGAPFLPLSPKVYANLLGKLTHQHNTRVWLVNTGWSGGPFGIGSRIKLPYTRALIKAAINNDLASVNWYRDEIFHLEIPESCPNVPDELLNPALTWSDRQEYLEKANYLAGLFEENHASMNI
jgi:phosphoenolpyruvate carboxykinase (ATP)